MILNHKEHVELLDHCQKIVKQQGKYILKSWNKIGQTSYKNVRDIVTNIDVEVEKKLRKDLRRLLPEAGFIVEEGKTERKKTYNWVIDPIDGTKNYASQMPMFVSQIALVENDQPILGIVYNPVSDQLFSAAKNQGTYLNNKKCLIKKTISLNSAIIDVDLGGSSQFDDWRLSVLSKLIEKYYRVRIFGGIFTAYLVTGAIDGYIVLDNRIKQVDYLPNIIIAQEAGYKIAYVGSSINQKFLIISHPSIFQKIKLILLT